jgi:hypothetical protein
MSGLDVLAVMDADGRAVALLRDLTVNRVKEGWEAHLPAHDEARAAVAELIETSARTVSAFEALGDANGIVHTRVAQRKCEAALVAQKEALARVSGGA